MIGKKIDFKQKSIKGKVIMNRNDFAKKKKINDYKCKTRQDMNNYDKKTQL